MIQLYTYMLRTFRMLLSVSRHNPFGGWAYFARDLIKGCTIYYVAVAIGMVRFFFFLRWDLKRRKQKFIQRTLR